MTKHNICLRLSKWIFVACGIWLIGLGGYFMFARPSLLPEDLRYTGATAMQVEQLLPNLASWLKNVFTVMGGFMAGCGGLTAFLGVRVILQYIRALGFAGALTVATMSWTNFVLDSDFKWLLFAPALAWWLGLVCCASGARTEHTVVAEPKSNGDRPR